MTHLSRRGFIAATALSATTLWAKGVLAEELSRTPAMTEGPFYPVPLPLDTDNDLLIINDKITPAIGEITHLSGRILDASGAPLRNALVEIWQVDGNGAYLHKGSENGDNRDKNFQGFGRFLTGSTGEYYFRTIKPVPYPGRPAPHIHFKIKLGDKELLTTQCAVRGAKGLDRDMVLRDVGDARARELVLADFTPIKESRIGELAAKFDIILGVTPPH